jgi:hypothetical protein
MNRFRIFIALAIISLTSLFLMSSDHADAPTVNNSTADISDFYAFAGQNGMVFVATLQGPLGPNATEAASFDENIMIEFNIDNNGDNYEDLVIQAVAGTRGKTKRMWFFGPVFPSETGKTSTVELEATYQGVVDITPYGQDAIIATNSQGMKFFAGPRDDPFFFDLTQYNAIQAGTAFGFNSTGTDSYAGKNVMAVVVEVPTNLLGGNGTVNCWVTTKRKQ